MAFDFGALKKEETVTPKSATPRASRTDWKKKYEDLEELMNQSNREFNKALEIGKKAYDELQAAFALSNENNSKLQAELAELTRWADAVKKEETKMYELKDEIHRLTVQGNMDKKALNQVTMQLVKFQFDPQKFSQLAQLLTYLRVHGNKQALIRVKEIVGTTELGAVRKWIFDLLEDPYK